MLPCLRPLFRLALLALFAAAATAQTTTPAKPVITSYDATSSTPSFHGTSDPGVAITVSTYSSYPALTTTAAADGTWNVSWTGTPLAPGTYYFNAYATNAAGARSATSDSVVIKSPPTSVPVITPIPDQETTWQYREKDYDQLVLLNVTNLPDRIDATNAPPGTRVSVSSPSGFYYTLGGITGGKFHVTVTATNAVGTSAPMSFDWTIHPAPTYWFVPNGHDYVPGNVLSFRVDFSAPVVVTGSPFIPLWGTKKAVYASGSGTKTLTFSYTIADDDPSITGFTATDIVLGDGTITTVDGVSAGLHMSYYFGSAPTINVASSVAEPAAITSVYVFAPSPAWNEVNVSVAFSQDITISGSLLLHFTIGGVAHTATASTSSAHSVSFLYKAQPGDHGALALQSPLESGGSVVDQNGLAANLAFNPPDTSAMPVEGSPPVVQNVTINGQVGTPLAPVQLHATNSPGSFSTTYNLSNYGLQLSGYGYITGVPTQTANGVTIPLTASNDAGQSAPGTITLNIAAAPTTKTPQTITFASPTGAVMVNQPITLGATSSAGLPITYLVMQGGAYINGNTLTPMSTATLIARAYSGGDATYAPASTDVNFGNPQKAAQTITASTTTQTVKANSTLTLSATSSSGLPVTYTVISGPATVSGNTLTVTGTSGTIQVRASQAGNDTYTAANDVTLNFTIGPVATSRLVNISSRLHVSANDSAGASIAGFVVTGSVAKQFLIRGVGPTLVGYGISSPLAAPQLKLYDEHSTVVATNSGWNDDPQIAAAASAVGAFKYLAGSKDAALLVTLAPGAHTVQVSSTGSGTGMIEVYDVSAVTESTKQLINISTRGTVGSGDDVLIGGFVITGDQPKRVLIRGIGPKLADYGVAGALSDPAVTVYDSNQKVVAKNDNWGTPQPVTTGQQVGTAAEISAAATATGAFPLPAGSADAVLLLTLPPGGYSAVVTGANNASGAAMVEIYEVPE